MSALTVRNIEEDVVRRLRIRAAENGRSAEAEHREILRAALLAPAADQPSRAEIMARLDEVRRRTAGRSAQSVTELLAESRAGRMAALTGDRSKD